MPLDIVDAQVHLYLTMNERECLAAMDALGIQACLIDEFWGYGGESHNPPPGYRTSAGVFRAVAPGAMAASMRYPHRFGWLLRIDPKDPEMDNLMSLVRQHPQGRAVRLEVRSEEQVASFRAGGDMAFFKSAQRHGLPVFVLCPRNARFAAQYAAACPDARIAIDHLGLPETIEEYNQLLEMARLPNVYVKWCNAPRVFKVYDYPFSGVDPYLEQALDKFGRERLIWASDFTAIKVGHRWADALFYVRESPVLSPLDREWVLGRAARGFLDWSAPEKLSEPVLHRH